MTTTFNISILENATFFYEEDFNETCEIIPPEYPTRNPIFSTVVYTMYGVIFILALLGNIFVCYIVMQSPRMRTVTNYFITNLAVGDILITLLCVPFTSVTIMSQYWPFGSFMCPLVNYVSTLSVFVSAYTMVRIPYVFGFCVLKRVCFSQVAISIDKWMLIMYPLKPRISKRSATYIITVIWVVAGITVLPSGVFSTIFQPQGYKGNVSSYQRCDK